jgi:hypothetical protein
VVARYCATCHSDRLKTGNLSLNAFDVDAAPERAAVAERMIAKLRAEMMPPPTSRRPGGDTLMLLAVALEKQLDAAAAANPNPGRRTFHGQRSRAAHLTVPRYRQATREPRRQEQQSLRRLLKFGN